MIRDRRISKNAESVQKMCHTGMSVWHRDSDIDTTTTKSVAATYKNDKLVISENN